MTDNIIDFEVECPNGDPPCEYVPSSNQDKSYGAGILRTASELIDGPRNTCHGNRHACFRQIANYWSVYLDVPIGPEDVAQMMTLMKISRTQTGAWNEDNFVDACGYQALGAELAKEAKK